MPAQCYKCGAELQAELWYEVSAGKAVEVMPSEGTTCKSCATESLPISTQGIIAEIDASIRAARPNRNLVTEGFSEYLDRLGLPMSEIAFYGNLDEVTHAIEREVTPPVGWDANWNSEWNDFDGPYGKVWDTARGVALDFARKAAEEVGWGTAWDTLWNGAQSSTRKADAVWDAARHASMGAVWSAAWDASHSDADAVNPLIPFLKIIRGGCFCWWLTPNKIHVLLLGEVNA